MSFEDRGKAEENRFAHEQELAFKIRNRRNKLFGMWAAEQHLGKSGDDAVAYAKDVVMADFADPGHFDAFTKVKEDLEQASKQISDHLMHKRLIECEQEARRQVMSE